MTVVELSVDRLVDPLIRDQPDQLHDEGQAGCADGYAHQQKALQLETFTVVGLPVRGRGRVHDLTILTLIVVTQLCWLSALGYVLVNVLP